MKKIYKVDSKKIEAKINEKNKKIFSKLLICIIIVLGLSLLLFLNPSDDIPVGILLLGVCIEIPTLLCGSKYFLEYILNIGWTKYQKAYNYLVDEQENIYKITYKMDWNHYHNMASLTNSLTLEAISFIEDVNSLHPTSEYTEEQIVNVYSVHEKDGIFKVTCDMYDKKLNVWKLKCVLEISENIEDYQELIACIKKKITDEQENTSFSKTNNKFINLCLKVNLKWQKVIMITCYIIHYFLNLIAFYNAFLGYGMGIFYLIISLLLVALARMYAKNFSDLSQDLKYMRYNNVDLIATIVIYFIFIMF